MKNLILINVTTQCDKITRFDYVILNKQLNIVKKNSIVLNPCHKKGESIELFGRKVLIDNKSRKNLKNYYHKLKKLMSNNLVIGWDLTNTIKCLKRNLKEWNLDLFSFSFYNLNKIRKLKDYIMLNPLKSNWYELIMSSLKFMEKETGLVPYSLFIKEARSNKYE